MNRLKAIFTNWRVLLALAILLLAVIAIYPNPWAEGAAIRSVKTNSTASIAGFESPKPTSTPMSRERVIAVNNLPVKDANAYYEIVNKIGANRTVNIKTTKQLYQVRTRELTKTIVLNETEYKNITEEVFNNATNTTKNVTKQVLVNKTKTTSIGVEDIGLSVYDAPTTNIRKGLDLQGGTRVLLQPETELTKDEMSMLLENMKYRLNVYGLSDLVVREASDLSGHQYVSVEIAGAKEEEVKELLSKQGKFEATIGNQTVFKGGSDITYVCRSAECSGIARDTGCGATSDGQWACRFMFSIALSPEAAQRQADLSKDLTVINEGGDDYLSEKLILYLDDVAVDELNIGADLKGRAVTDIAISGSGAGRTREEAITNALENMKKLQTVLITGSLPVKLNIVKTDNLSALFGKELLNNSLFIGFIALIAVSLSIFLRYRKIQLVIPIIMTSVIELVVMLGIAAVISWNIDLAAIAGIVISIGTGVNDQIIITDETLRGSKTTQIYNWKDRIKNAFFIVFGAYFTLLAAMIPLYLAGAGLLKGFAVTSIIGLTVGVLITRPAYGQVVEMLIKE